jgi:hypothetical protein
VAALAGDGRGYRAKGDANATWEEMLFVHGRRRRTTAKFSITSATDHDHTGVGVGVGDTVKQGYGRGKRNGIVGAWRDGWREGGDCTAQKLTVAVVFSQFHSFSLGSSRIHTSHNFGTPLLEPLISSNSGKNAV